MRQLPIPALAIFLSFQIGSAYGAGLESICDLENKDATSLINQNFHITYKTDPHPVSVSEPFTLHILVCSTDGIPYENSLKINAQMPKHKHGMNLKPKTIKISPGSYQASGMMFHMPGDWQYQFSLKKAGKTTRLTSDYRLK